MYQSFFFPCSSFFSWTKSYYINSTLISSTYTNPLKIESNFLKCFFKWYYFWCKVIKMSSHTSNILVVKVSMPAFVSNEYELAVEFDLINELGDLTILATIFFATSKRIWWFNEKLWHQTLTWMKIWYEDFVYYLNLKSNLWTMRGARFSFSKPFFKSGFVYLNILQNNCCYIWF